MGKKSEKKLVFKATLSDQATAKLGLIATKMKGMQGPIDKLRSKFNKLSWSLSPFKKKIDDLAKSFKKLGFASKIGIGAMAMAPAAGISSGVLTAADVQTGLNSLEVIAKLDPQSLVLLKDEAIDIGKRTQFSTTEVLSGMTYLASNGMSNAKDIKNAITPTMDLTGASHLKSDIPLAEVAKTLTGTMNAFDLKANLTNSVADKLAFAIRESSMNMEELGESLRPSAPLARVSGSDVDTLLGTMMMLAKTNVKGSIAGTAVTGTFSRLLNQTANAEEVLLKYKIDKGKFFKKDGTIKNLVGFFEELERKKITASDVMLLLQEEAGKYMTALIGHTKEWKETIKSISENSLGVAKEMNDVNMQGFHGQIKFMKSSLETISIKLGDTGLLALAEQAAQSINNILCRIIDLESDNFKLLAAATGFAALLPLLVVTLTKSTGVLAAIAAFGGGSALLGGAGLTAISLGVAGLVAALGSYGLKKYQGMEKEYSDHWQNALNELILPRYELQQNYVTPYQPNQGTKYAYGSKFDSQSLIVDFRNVPRGTDVKAPTNLKNFDLNVQYEDFD